MTLASHPPKLSLMTGARLLLTMYTAARSIPAEASVDSAITKSMVAFGATAPDHSTSRSPSVSSELKPGSGPSRITLGKLAASPNKLRKVATSSEEHVIRVPLGPKYWVLKSGELAVQISESPTMAID